MPYPNPIRARLANCLYAVTDADANRSLDAANVADAILEAIDARIAAHAAYAPHPSPVGATVQSHHKQRPDADDTVPGANVVADSEPLDAHSCALSIKRAYESGRNDQRAVAEPYVPTPVPFAMGSTTMAFEAEMATYERNKELLLESEGQFVVIKGDDILGRYPTYSAAYDQGVKTFDHKPFLIKQILREDPVMFTPPYVPTPVPFTISNEQFRDACDAVRPYVERHPAAPFAAVVVTAVLKALGLKRFAEDLIDNIKKE